MATLPLALIGGVWLMYWLDYELSVATAVGFIAPAGVAAECGVVMVLYLRPRGTIASLPAKPS